MKFLVSLLILLPFMFTETTVLLCSPMHKLEHQEEDILTGWRYQSLSIVSYGLNILELPCVLGIICSDFSGVRLHRAGGYLCSDGALCKGSEVKSQGRAGISCRAYTLDTLHGAALPLR